MPLFNFQVRGKTHLRGKRATENEKIAKKALTKGIESILKSSDNGEQLIDAIKKAVKEIVLVPTFLELVPILGVIYAIFR